MDSTNQPEKFPYAIVFELDSINGLMTARILARHGIPVIGIASDPKHPCCRTRVCKEILYANTESVIAVLESLGQRLDQRAVLFPCNNIEVMLVSRYRQQLEKWYYIRLAKDEVVERLMLKTNLYAYAQQAGFSIPRTFQLHTRAEAEETAQMLTFPCILKPSYRSDEWEKNSRYKAYKAFSKDDFLIHFDRCIQWCENLIAQEWIEGPDSNLYTCYCYFSAESEPLVTFVTRKVRQWPPELGEGCLGEECRNDIVLQETVRLFQSVGLSGLGYLEMKCDSRTGKYYLVEPNIGRPTSKSALAEAGGVELVYTMYCDALGWALPENRTQTYGKAKWIFLRQDLQSAIYYWRRGELSLVEWRQSLRGPKVEAMFSREDPAPFWYDLMRAIGKFLSPWEHKKSTYRNPFPHDSQVGTRKLE